MIGAPPITLVRLVGSKADLPSPDTNGLVAYDNSSGVMYISNNGSWVEIRNSDNVRVDDDIVFLEGSSIRTRLVCRRLLSQAGTSSSLSSAIIGDKSFKLLRFMSDPYLHYDVVYMSDEDSITNEVKVTLHDSGRQECAKVLVNSECTIDEALQKFYDNLDTIDDSVKTVFRSSLSTLRSATIEDLIDSRNSLSDDTIYNYII